MEPVTTQAPGEATQVDAAPQQSQQPQESSQQSENQPQAQSQQPVAPQPPPDIPEEFRGMAHVREDGKVVVPIDAILDERRKRQDFEKRLRDQEQELFLMRQFQHAPQPQQPQQEEEFKLPDVINKLADDEVVNGAEVKNALKEFATAMRQRQAAPQNERQNEMIGETMIQAMDPQGAQRIQMGIQQIAVNPMIQQQMRMVNPMLRPFIAYRMGMGDHFNQAAQTAVMQTGQPLQQAPPQPGYQQMQPGFQQAPPQPQQAPQPQYQQVANQPMNYQQVAANQNIPPATSAVDGTSPVNQAQYWATAPKDEFERKLQLIKNGQS